jgi:hypothetical protein
MNYSDETYSNKDLLQICKERGIKCKSKPNKQYIIDLLQQNDAAPVSLPKTALQTEDTGNKLDMPMAQTFEDTGNKLDMPMAQTFDHFLSNKYQESLKTNDNELTLEAERRDPKLLFKINNYIKNKMTEEERKTNTVDSILESIKTVPMIRSIFRKDPIKQSTDEIEQIEWIQRHQHSDAFKMPSNTNGTCLSKNKFHEINKNNPRPSDATKTFDVHVPSKKLFAVLKHTTTAGGAQDNQYRDVKDFVQQIVGYLSENQTAEECFAFYLDGTYYTPKKYRELEDMIPVNHKSKIIITSCASIKPKDV